MNTRAAAALIYGGGLAQGLALVSFPAASSILTSPTGYDLIGAGDAVVLAMVVIVVARRPGSNGSTPSGRTSAPAGHEGAAANPTQEPQQSRPPVQHERKK